LAGRPEWLTVSKSASGVPLAASAAGLSRGAYSATLVVQASGGLPQATYIPVTFVVGASDAVSIAGVTNGASFRTEFAPGMVMSVFGAQLAPSIQVASALPLPFVLNGVSATVNGVSAPLYFVSPNQLNVQVP